MATTRKNRGHNRGTSGIGFATAQLLAARALRLHHRRRATELDAALSAIGKNVTGVQGDVSNLADLDRLYGVVKREKGHIDILFANAGVAQKRRSERLPRSTSIASSGST